MSRYRHIVIFDLDETVINSAHRTPNNEDGTLNLDAYIALHKPANVNKDTLLPLARLMKQCYDNGAYVIVCTARDMKSCDYQFLARHGLPYHKLFSRDQCRENPGHYRAKDGEYKRRWLLPYLRLKQFEGLPVVMFDDAKPVKTVLRSIGIPVICAHRANRIFARG
jgi:FMN phosphatase YigB (HAD superfamily)